MPHIFDSLSQGPSDLHYVCAMCPHCSVNVFQVISCSRILVVNSEIQLAHSEPNSKFCCICLFCYFEAVTSRICAKLAFLVLWYWRHGREQTVLTVNPYIFVVVLL